MLQRATQLGRRCLTGAQSRFLPRTNAATTIHSSTRWRICAQVSTSFTTVTTVGATETTLTQLLHKKVESGTWRSDKAQQKTSRKLERLQQVLEGYSNETVIQYVIEQEEEEMRKRIEPENQEESESTAITESPTLRNENNDSPSDSLATGEKTSPTLKAEAQRVRVPRGLYLHGSVGIGKSMLMDFFYDHANVAQKQRFHFHAFMAHVHERLHKLKQEQLQTQGRNFTIDTNPQHNPIRNVARRLASETSLLCLDEFQVTDVADAMILLQLFETLWEMGTVVVATSNRLPSELYEGGLNRSYFMPFVDQLERHCIVHTMKSGMDYRVALTDSSLDHFFLHSRETSHSEFGKLVGQLREGGPSTVVSLNVGRNRELLVEHGDDTGRLAHFSFEELCDTELGASDYRALSQHFDILAIENIPLLSLEDPNRARRFVTLIDELYETKSTALLCRADQASPFDLFQGRQVVQANKEVAPEDAPPALGIDQAEKNGLPLGALASIRELSFAFERAASRITEMTSRRWWDLVLENPKS